MIEKQRNCNTAYNSLLGFGRFTTKYLKFKL